MSTSSPASQGSRGSDDHGARGVEVRYVPMSNASGGFQSGEVRVARHSHGAEKAPLVRLLIR